MCDADPKVSGSVAAASLARASQEKAASKKHHAAGGEVTAAAASISTMISFLALGLLSDLWAETDLRSAGEGGLKYPGAASAAPGLTDGRRSTS